MCLDVFDADPMVNFQTKEFSGQKVIWKNLKGKSSCFLTRIVELVSTKNAGQENLQIPNVQEKSK